jgi:hypothetical protein
MTVQAWCMFASKRVRVQVIRPTAGRTGLSAPAASSCSHAIAVVTGGGRSVRLLLFAAAAAAARGQMLPLSASSPVEGPCQAVDFELEMVRSDCS